MGFANPGLAIRLRCHCLLRNARSAKRALCPAALRFFFALAWLAAQCQEEAQLLWHGLAPPCQAMPEEARRCTQRESNSHELLRRQWSLPLDDVHCCHSALLRASSLIASLLSVLRNRASCHALPSAWQGKASHSARRKIKGC